MGGWSRWRTVAARTVIGNEISPPHLQYGEQDDEISSPSQDDQISPPHQENEISPPYQDEDISSPCQESR